MSQTTESGTERRLALVQAADAARHAPSVHNTQPWRWVAYPDRLELHAATERQLNVQDPDGHMMLLSCGTALHHARVALLADGRRHEVDRPAGNPLATLRPTSHEPADPAAARRFEALRARRTDRRTVRDDPVRPDVLQTLVEAAEGEESRLHLLDRDQTIELAVLMEQAQKTQAADADLQAETEGWIGGDRSGGTGIPDSALPSALPPTTVAERDFGAAGTLDAGQRHDTGAVYAVLYGPDDEPVNWLRAGEALSALWLTATEQGVAVLPLSSPVEVPYVRHQLRRLLGDIGFPFLVLRLGNVEPDRAGTAATPRLQVEQLVEFRD